MNLKGSSADDVNGRSGEREGGDIIIFELKK